MPLPIEDYALIGDCHTGALVGTDGSIDWLCLPRFDSASTFGALLGDKEQGHWRLSPVGVERCTSRAYEADSFVLVTRWETDTGEVEVVDLMPHGDRRADVVRRVRGIRGTVRMEQVIRIRFDYADAIPWIRQSPEHDAPGEHGHAILAVAGPDAVVIRGPKLAPDDLAHRAEFDVAEGETVDTVLTWYPAHRTPPPPVEVDERIKHTLRWWQEWADGCVEPGRYDDAGAPVAAGAARPHPRGHRRRRRRGDHEPARAGRRRAQLGLPLRLAARRRADAQGAHGARLRVRGRGVARLAAAGDRR